MIGLLVMHMNYETLANRSQHLHRNLSVIFNRTSDPKYSHFTDKKY